MILNSKDLKYPLALVSNNWVLTYVRSDEDLFICNKRMLKRGYFNKLKLIDSNGSYFLIDKATKAGHVGIFWGYDIFLDQKLKIDLTVRDINNKIELEDFKKLILNAFKENEDFWDSDGVLEERIKFIQETKSHSEIIERMTEEFFQEY